MVNDDVQRGKAVKINNPVDVWKGSFRDETPVDRNHKPWKPNGLAASLYNTGSCGLISTAKFVAHLLWLCLMFVASTNFNVQTACTDCQ